MTLMLMKFSWLKAENTELLRKSQSAEAKAKLHKNERGIIKGMKKKRRLKNGVYIFQYCANVPNQNLYSRCEFPWLVN